MLRYVEKQSSLWTSSDLKGLTAAGRAEEELCPALLSILSSLFPLSLRTILDGRACSRAKEKHAIYMFNTPDNLVFSPRLNFSVPF